MAEREQQGIETNQQGDDKQVGTELAEAEREQSLWEKLAGSALKAGESLVEKVLILYYAARDERTPTWARTAIWGAIAYFVAPIDGIPDLTPLLGYSDDVGIIAGALATVAAYIRPSHKEKAKASLKRWFGKAEAEDSAD